MDPDEILSWKGELLFPGAKPSRDLRESLASLPVFAGETQAPSFVDPHTQSALRYLVPGTKRG